MRDHTGQDVPLAWRTSAVPLATCCVQRVGVYGLTQSRGDVDETLCIIPCENLHNGAICPKLQKSILYGIHIL